MMEAYETYSLWAKPSSRVLVAREGIKQAIATPIAAAVVVSPTCFATYIGWNRHISRHLFELEFSTPAKSAP